MDRKEQLTRWGEHLQGLAQAGLYYGVNDDADIARMNRLWDIAKELMAADDIAPEHQKELGEEIYEMSQIGLEDGCNNIFDMNRYKSIQEAGEDLKEPKAAAEDDAD